MKIIIVVLTLILAYIDGIRNSVTIALTIVWAIYTIYQIIKLLIVKDKKIITKKILEYPPNDNYASHIRYLYKRKVDSKSFICTIFELILKNSISLKRSNSEYYFIDNQVKDEVLTKNEESVKKILFRELGNTENVSLSNIKKMCKKNIGYLSIVLKEWKITCEYECIKDKYFKSVKKIIEDYVFYFAISLIIAIYNILFTKYILIAVLIFLITAILSVITNDLKNISDESISEYKNWLEFKNYLDSKNNNISTLDNSILERYALYAYVLDSYKSFKKQLLNKYLKDNDSFNDSVLLSIMNASIFDEIEKEIRKSINNVNIKSYLYAKNKGRRV